MMIKSIFKGIGLASILCFGGRTSAQAPDEILDSLIQQVDTTAFGYGMEEDSSVTENLLVENFEAQFVVDSIMTAPDSLVYGKFLVSFDLKEVNEFGAVQIEVAKLVGESTMLLNILTYSSAELTLEDFLLIDSAEIPIQGEISPGTYFITIVPMTGEGAALKILTQTILL